MRRAARLTHPNRARPRSVGRAAFFKDFSLMQPDAHQDLRFGVGPSLHAELKTKRRPHRIAAPVKSRKEAVSGVIDHLRAGELLQHTPENVIMPMQQPGIQVRANALLKPHRVHNVREQQHRQAMASWGIR